MALVSVAKLEGGSSGGSGAEVDAIRRGCQRPSATEVAAA